MVEDRPDPAILDDLLSDADRLGFPSLNERLVREWHQKGLIGSPCRLSLGRGRGQAPALYSSEQRALFIAVVRNRARGYKYTTLATIPVWAWLNFGEDWVEMGQLRRALRTAIGPNPRRSVKAACKAANVLVCQIDLHHASYEARTRLRKEISAALNLGQVNYECLRAAVAGVYEPCGVAIVRGPAGAPLTVDSITALLDARIRGMKELYSATDEALLLARSRHQESWPEYQARQAAYSAEAGPQLASLFAPSDVTKQVEDSVSEVVLLLGIERQRTDRAAHMDAHR
ncbi:hypothetical protein [Frankia sp. Cppng1_Ct_nod]|uniref:hypothetical protein n=1 Tax=Frankia sp. Cppng1_Ct_nod TaxID=2897162 RepID=UPI0020259AB6|nr:hypothetical protein [Frankia sp. Cppng1_Ct_nod]